MTIRAYPMTLTSHLRHLACLVTLTWLAGACGGAAPKDDGAPVDPPAEPSAPAGAEAEAAVALSPAAGPITERRVFTTEIRTYEDFLHYSDQVAGERFTKAIIDLKTDKVYYFDVNVYPLHSDFIFAELYKTEETPDNLARYMDNYNEEKPEFILIYLVHHVAQGIWAFAFWEGDQGRPVYVEKTYERLKATFYNAGEVKFRPDSPYQEEMAKRLDSVPVITNDAIYSQQTYQLFNPGRSIGVLRVIDDISDEAVRLLTYDAKEILILNETIPTLTVVSGVLSEEFSTPLSHVALRARAWGIPHVGLKNASAMFRHLDGKTVRFEATAAGYDLRLASVDEVKAWKAKREKARVVLLPAIDLDETVLRPLTDLRASQVSAYGAKTSNLGEIVHHKVEGCVVPPGFGIPISYYAAHMKAHGLDKRVEAMLEDAKFQKDAAYRRDTLTELRSAILAAPIDTTLLDEVTTQAEALGTSDEDRGVFVRSSTNAEDLAGFSGAGLYDTVPFVMGREKLEIAIKTVWASVWNKRAYEERQHFGIDHRAVFGAVLVQKAVPATAAGVLITANIYDRHDDRTYTINAKSGLGIRVVEGKKVPEQILFDYRGRHMKVLSRSDEDTMLVFDAEGGVKEVPSPGKGEVVLTHKRAATLVDVSRRLVEVFPKDNPLDIEWLFVGDDLQIVQSRPYVTK